MALDETFDTTTDGDGVVGLDQQLSSWVPEVSKHVNRGTFVVHGSDASVARPTPGDANPLDVVLWFGTVAPSNRADGDGWYDRANNAWKRWDASAGQWVSSVLNSTGLQDGELVRYDAAAGQLERLDLSAAAEDDLVGLTAAGVPKIVGKDTYPPRADRMVYPDGLVLGQSPSASDITNNTSVLQSAFADALAANGLLDLPYGHVVYNDKLGTITDQMAMVGRGPKVTVFHPAAGYTGPFLEIADAWRAGGEEPGDTTVDFTASGAGVLLQSFSVAADRATAARGIDGLSRIDHLWMVNVWLGFLNGRALSFGALDTLGLLRESRFFGCVVFGCGNATEPAVEFNTGATVGDGTNQITWVGGDIADSFGLGLKIASKGTLTRRFRIYGLMLHGKGDRAEAPSEPLALVEGSVADIEFHGLKQNGSHYDGTNRFATVRFAADGSGNKPGGCKLDGDVRSCDGHGVILEDFVNGRVELRASPASVTGNELRVEANALGGVPSRIDVYGPQGSQNVFLDPTVTGNIDGRIYDKRYVSAVEQTNRTFVNNTGLFLQTAAGSARRTAIMDPSDRMLFGNPNHPFRIDGTEVVILPGITRYGVLTSAPSTPQTGAIYCADPSGWDPLSLGAVGPYFVRYDGSNFQPLSA